MLPENNNSETNDEYMEMKTEIRHHRKLIKTREEVEMMKNGLIDVFNVPMTNHTKRMNFMECRRTLKEILEGMHNRPVDEKFSKTMLRWKMPEIERTYNKIEYHKSRRPIKHWSLPEIEIQNKGSTLTKEVQLTSLSNKQHNQVIEVDINTTEHMVVEELWYKMEDTYFTRTKIVRHTKVCLLYTSRCV